MLNVILGGFGEGLCARGNGGSMSYGSKRSGGCSSWMGEVESR